MARLIKAELARQANVTPPAISKAVRKGRLPESLDDKDETVLCYIARHDPSPEKIGAHVCAMIRNGAGEREVTEALRINIKTIVLNAKQDQLEEDSMEMSIHETDPLGLTFNFDDDDSDPLDWSEGMI